MARFQFHLRRSSSLDPSPTSEKEEEEEEEEEEGEEEEEEEDFEQQEEFSISSPMIMTGLEGGIGGCDGGGHHSSSQYKYNRLSITAVLVTALRKSLVMCSVGAVEDGDCPASSMDISWPSDVRHIAHVTFDRFDGFLGLPVELQPEVPSSAPSASASVFGVSPESMQCSYDKRGNSVPTILLSMQRHLYLQGGLQVEGIFRINAENSQEKFVRDQLNRGTVPQEIDSHCLAGLIKAWFRELPQGVLDSLSPDQVMQCNTEEDCSELARTLPPTEAALLDWSINLMADVVEHENYNKMNARNIAMVFAPNMTQMADPLTALIHAVQVMNLLKTLIIKTQRQRDEATIAVRLLSSGSKSPSDRDESESSKPSENYCLCRSEKNPNLYDLDKVALRKFLFNAASTMESDDEESLGSSEKKNEIDDRQEFISTSSSIICDLDPLKDGSKRVFAAGDAEGVLDKLSFRKGVKKLCNHPVFQLSRSTKKLADISILNSRGEEREACA